MNSESDIEIINRIRNGLSADFGQLVERYSDRIYQFLFAKSRNSNDIDDILQETFLKAFLNIKSYKEEYQFSTWLYTIAYRELCRSASKNKNIKIQNINQIDSITSRPIETKLGIWEDASKLNTVYYTVLWLKYHEELDVKEIAAIMKSSVAIVKINLFRARHKLKNIMLVENKKSEKKSHLETICSQSSF